MDKLSYQRPYCTKLCPRRKAPEAPCDLCRVLDERDRFWQQLYPSPLRWLWAQLKVRGWNLWADLTGPLAYRIWIASIVTIIGAYFGLYAVFEAKHERLMNRALFERNTFMTMVTSGQRGIFIAAMKDFGAVQTLVVPTSPLVWPPFQGWSSTIQPNLDPLHRWAKYYLLTCTTDECGREKRDKYANTKTWRIDLLNAFLNKAFLQDVDLSLTVMRDSQLQEANLSRANLAGADLAGADLRGAVMRGAQLQEADLRRANLEGADLKGFTLASLLPSFANIVADPNMPLSHAMLRQKTVYLRGAILRWDDLRTTAIAAAFPDGFRVPQAIWQGPYVRVADLQGANLGTAHLTGADLQGADLYNADFNRAQMQGVDLRWADLTGTNLYLADLTGADLRWADLNGANLDGANLDGVRFLHQHQVSVACVDSDTVLPSDLIRPVWSEDCLKRWGTLLPSGPKKR